MTAQSLRTPSALFSVNGRDRVSTAFTFLIDGAVRQFLLATDLDLASENFGMVLKKDSLKLDARRTAHSTGNLGKVMGEVDRFGDMNFAVGSKVKTFDSDVTES